MRWATGPRRSEPITAADLRGLPPQQVVSAMHADVLAAGTSLCLKGLDPALAALGVMIGLLTAGEEEGTYCVVPAWFADPYGNVKNAVSGDGTKLAQLLAQLLGSVAGQALGVPVKDPAIAGTWYPINLTDDGGKAVPTGLAIASYPDAVAGTEVFGLGAMRRWDVGSTTKFTVEAFAMMPFVKVGAGKIEPVLTTPGYPITLGIAVEGAHGGKLLDLGDVSCTGVKVGATLDLAKPAADASVVIMQLQLPDDAQPRDRSLSDLATASAAEIQSAAAALFVGALSAVSATFAERAPFVLPLLGLSTKVPGATGAVPLLSWEQLFAQAVAGGEISAPFQAWFTALAADPAAMSAWLTALAGAMGASATVGGTGTREDPFAVALIDASTGTSAVGVLSFTMASVVAADGKRSLYPGLRFASAPIAVGTGSTVLRMSAAAELAQFSLAGGHVSFGAPEDLDFSFRFALTDKDAAKPLAAVDGYSFGALTAGVELSAGVTPVPHLSLSNVVTPDSSYGAIDLLSPGQLATTAADILQSKILSLLGISTGATAGSFAHAVAALIGVVAPSGTDGTWPAPPFSASQLLSSLQHPVDALAAYYATALTGTSGGKAAFTYLLGELTNALHVSTSGTIAVTGDGTAASPWQAPLTSDAAMPAVLTAYTQSVQRAAGPVTQLVLGLALAPQLTLDGTTVVPNFTFDVVSIDLPKTGSAAPLTGSWAPRLSAGVALPGGFTSSTTGGVSFSMGPASLAASWDRGGGWNPALLVTDPVVQIGSTKIPLGQSLDISEGAALEQLVTGEVKAFLDLVAAVIGLGLVRTGSRAGIAAAGIFGLLDVSSAPGFPSGTWPTIPPLSLSGFQNPWPDLRAQLARNFADDPTGAGVLSLLAWAANSSLTALPVIAGTRAVAAPFVVPIGGLPFDLLGWFTDTAQVLGIGAARTKTFTAGSVDVTSTLRLNALEYSLQTGTVASGPNAPSLTLQAALTGTNGAPLVAGTAQTGILGSAVIGVTLALDGSGALTATPVVTLLDVTLPGEGAQAQITLADMQAAGFAERLRQGFLQLLNAGIAELGTAVSSNGAAQTAYDLLVDLGLALPRSTSMPLGINPGGWTALLADPAGFLASRLVTLLRDPALRDTLFTFALQQLGITLPAIPETALTLLSALGFVGPAEQGYPVRLDALIALARNPLATVASSFETLAADSAALAALGTALKGTFATTFAPFSLSVNGGSKIALGIPRANAVTIGGLVELWGTVNIDLAVPSVAVDLHVFAPAIEVEAISTLSYRPASGTAPAFGLALAWGDGTRPAPDPLTLYPFSASTFVPQLAALAPAYVLSTLATAAFQSQLLQQHPLVQKIFTGLGLAEQVGSTWQMPGLLGFIHSPKEWLLSEGILGSNGSFDVAGFAKWLGGLPAATSPSGIAVAPQADGVAITGLPYDLSVALTGANGKAQIAIAASGLAVAGGDGVFDLAVDVSLGPDYQPGFGGSVKATAAKLSVPFTVEAAYAGSFSLAVTQASGGLSLQILPFQGWGSLDAALGKLPALLLQELVPKLLDALSKAGATTFVSQLRASGTQLNVAALVSALGALPSPVTAAAIEDAALTWLLGTLQPAHAANTATAVAGLLQLVLPTQVTAVGGLVSYTPSPSIPLTVVAGLDPGNTLAGLWLDIAFPVSLLSIAVDRTGVGVPIAGGAPVISFGASLGVPIEPKTGPALTLAYDPTNGLTLSFDPLAPTQAGLPASFLARELLPTFFPAGGEQGDLATRVENWLLGVVTHVLPRYVAGIVLNQSDVATWLGTGIKGNGTPTPGGILEAASLLVARTPSGYDLVDVDTLLNLTPETFAANFLQALLRAPLQLLAFGKDDSGEIWIGPNPTDSTSYGVRLTAPNFAIPDVDHIVLQLGAPLTDGWIEGSGGKSLLGNRQPGIGVYVPLKDAQGNIAPSFGKMQIDLVNVGADFVGVQNAPLLDFRRFQLGEFEARTLVLIALNDGSPTARFGGAVTLDGLALSLAPNTLSPAGSGSNPVAQNLLGSGSTPAPNPPVNPAFTLSAAYTENLWVQLSSPSGSSNPVIIPVQRSFGPLHVDDFGVGWQKDQMLLDFLFDGSVALAGLQADLVGLQVGIPVTDITNVDGYKLDLQGLDVSFKGGAVSIAGAFLKTTNPLSYTGAALVQAANFGLTAIGSYAVLPAPTDENPNATAPSMFIFGALSAPLGGVPAFFITGIAAGFGYNRSLSLPDVGEVQNFPLVSGVLTGSFSEGQSPADAIKAMGTFVAPKVGDYWLAAGLKFTSFQLIDAVALLFLQFGRHIEIDLLGLASAPLPKGVPKGSALAYVELALKASIQPDEGIVSVQAQLTPNSYVIAKDCKLTGGFAFVLYLKDITIDGDKVSAGDFVLSLGGYHPAFRKPAHYPDVPRLGFNWKIDAGVGTVSIGGGAYFALVPTAVMAGGYLDVTFDAGPLRAWLHAAANFLVQWAPFYFEVDISVSIGVSFGTTIAGVSVTLTVELGADLILEGPPTHGHADVTWYVISFTIPFGSRSTATSNNTLEWEPFAKQFLPPAATAAVAAHADVGTGGTLAAAASPPQPLKATVQAGRLGGSNAASDAPWVVQAVPFAMRIDTAIPTATLTIGGTTTVLQGPAVGVRPMGVTHDLDAPLTVKILDHTGAAVPLAAQQMTFTPVTNGAAGALWSKAALDEGSPPDPATMIVPGALMGVVLNATSYAGSDTVPSFAIANLAYQQLGAILLPFANPPQYGPAMRYTGAQQQTSLALMMGSIATDAVAQQRNAAFATLRPFTTVAGADPNLTVMATSANLVVQAPPTLARPGVFQVLVPPAPRIVAATTEAEVTAVTPSEPFPARLVGSMRSYRSRATAPTPLLAGLPPVEPVLPRFVDETHGAAARAHVRALAARGPSLALQPGSLAIWEVDDTAPHAIDATGEPGMRAVCFDRFGQAVADVYDVPAGPRALPDGTRLVAVHADTRPDGLAGWQIDTSLVRINRYYALGPGCLVRVQNVHGPKSAGKSARRGLVSGAAFVDGNTVTAAGGVVRPGWIETVLRGGAQSFCVAVAGDADAAARVRVFATQDVRPGRVGTDPLAPEYVHVAGDVTVLSYAAPRGDDDGALTIVVRPGDVDTRVVGVYAGRHAAPDIEQHWSSFTLAQSAVDADLDLPVPKHRVAIVPAATDAPLLAATPSPHAAPRSA
ncbi:MAG: hypothetical protein JWN27_2169 [Candidatus Eremiobacteraeota bacterium]|nr:hypothetical protein [Candidatus Eremiobacteraeota bacterium]